MGAHNILFAVLLLFFVDFSAFLVHAEEAAAPNEAAVDLSAQLVVNGAGEEAATTIAPPEKPETPEYLKYCYYTQPEVCLSWNTAQNETNQNGGETATHKTDPNSCQCRPDVSIANSWYCCNVTAMSQISSCNNVSNWNNLHIHNATIAVLDLTTPIFQTLHSLAITGGNIKQLNGSFSRVSSIKCLNLSNNSILDISQRSLSSAPHMKFLDISNNNLTRIPMLNTNQNVTVNMGGNKHMLCANLVNTILRDSMKFLNPNASFCLMNLTHNWFNSTDSISIDELEIAARIQNDCPDIPGYGNCSCKAERTLLMDNQSKQMLLCRVDCSNLGLIELPPKLPANTFFLNISNNNITSIGKHFHTNPTYSNIFQLDADNNQISSIIELEATKFMEKFVIFYLRNNALSKLPVYLLTNSLSNNYLGRRIYLGGNKLQCDCNSAKVLKYWLLERERDIPDHADILCRNMPQRVMELQEIKVCQSPQDWTDYIYYLIAIEVILLLALITKVSYDYWVFKTAGYLPWPANKMPKLPCDWLCE